MTAGDVVEVLRTLNFATGETSIQLDRAVKRKAEEDWGKKHRAAPMR
jgi:hypothetical protein